MQKLAHEIYSFDEFRLDLTRGALFRGPDELKLRPKSFDVLKYLIENPGRLISKDELIESVWQGMAVTDDSLVQCLKDIRRALGDNSQQIIKTVPRRGYIFEKEVTENGTAVYTEETSGVHLVIEEMSEPPAVAGGLPLQKSERWKKGKLLAAIKQRKLVFAFVVSAIVLFGGGLAYGLFTFFRQPPASPFKSVSIKQLTHEGNATTAAISRDGKYFAYTAGDEDGKKSLWVSQIVAPNPTQIVASSDIYGLGAFSPDGNFVYYLREDGMYQTATFGGLTRKMRDGVVGRFSISPDGKQVAFMRIGAGDGLGSRVIVANTDGTGEERILAYRKPPESFGTGGCGWSPDGETLICAAGDNPMFGQQFPMALRVADGQQTPLTPGNWNLVSYPQWLPDGGGFLMRGWNSKNPGATFWHVTFPDGVTTPIYHSLDNYGQISLTADASAFVTIQFKSHLNLYAMDLSDERRQMKQLTFGPDGVDGSRTLTTTPDNRIVYNSAKGGNDDLWIMDSDGGNQRQLTFDASLEDGAMVSRDGRSVVFGVPSQGIWKIDLDGPREQ